MSQKLNFSVEEDDKLTEKVRKHQPLYNMQHKLYKDARVKDNIWKEVAQYVGRPVADCKRHWKNIKDTYDRQKREKTPTGSDSQVEKKRQKWQLAEKLSFLQPCEHQRPSISNIDDTSQNKTATQSEMGQDTEILRSDEGVDVARQQYESGSNMQRRKSASLPMEALIPQTSHCPSGKGRKDRFLSVMEKRRDQREEMLRKLVAEEEDDVDLFFRSIAKSVKKLSPVLITQFKLQTLTLVANMETQMATVAGRAQNLYYSGDSSTSSGIPTEYEAFRDAGTTAGESTSGVIEEDHGIAFLIL